MESPCNSNSHGCGVRKETHLFDQWQASAAHETSPCRGLLPAVERQDTVDRIETLERTTTESDKVARDSMFIGEPRLPC